MLHAGLALELSRTMWEDRRAEAPGPADDRPALVAVHAPEEGR
jgi:hypothetical protein